MAGCGVFHPDTATGFAEIGQELEDCSLGYACHATAGPNRVAFYESRDYLSPLLCG